MLLKGIPVSSVLYNIATNYNHWRLKCIRSDDSFYSYYFRAVRKVSVMYDTTKQTLILSGDVELNPGPLTDNTINDVCFYNSSDFTLRYRVLRHGLIPLDVGGEGDRFFRSVSHQLPYLPVYKSTFYNLKICPKNGPRLIHGSKTKIKKR